MDTPPPEESIPRIPTPPPIPTSRQEPTSRTIPPLPTIPNNQEPTPRLPPPPPSTIQSDQQQLPSINQMMGQNQQCLQCSSWDHTTFNCH